MSDDNRLSPLPLYGLAGPFSGARWQEGSGWDLNSVVHRDVGANWDLLVGVDRRATARSGRAVRPAAIPAELARWSVANTLVADLPGVGAGVFELTDELAGDDEAWRRRDIVVDGETVAGHETEFRGRWLAYFLTPELIVYVVAPTAARLDRVVLRKLAASDLIERDAPLI